MDAHRYDRGRVEHPPSARLIALFDGVRVLTRTLLRAHEEYGTVACNHRRRAKRRAIAILHAGTMAKRIPLYKDLLKITHTTVRAAERWRSSRDAGPWAWSPRFRTFFPS